MRPVTAVEGKGIKNTHAQTKHKRKRFGETVCSTPHTWTSPAGVVRDCDFTFCSYYSRIREKNKPLLQVTTLQMWPSVSLRYRNRMNGQMCRSSGVLGTRCSSASMLPSNRSLMWQLRTILWDISKRHTKQKPDENRSRSSNMYLNMADTGCLRMLEFHVCHDG